MIIINTGLTNEKEFINSINNKKIDQIESEFLKYCLYTIFSIIKNDDIFYCRKIYGNKKTDLQISKNNEISFFVSIKSGQSCSIHQQNVNDFVKFLYNIGVSKESLKFLLFYHFGDGTINGSGKQLLPLDEIKISYYKQIRKLNEEINSNKIIRNVYKKVLIGDDYPIDFIIYGNINFGYIISIKEIMSFVNNYNFDYISSIHFGPFIYQNYSRFSLNKKRRVQMQLKWKSILSDIELIISNKKV